MVLFLAERCKLEIHSISFAVSLASSLSSSLTLNHITVPSIYSQSFSSFQAPFTPVSQPFSLSMPLTFYLTPSPHPRLFLLFLLSTSLPYPFPYRHTPCSLVSPLQFRPFSPVPLLGKANCSPLFCHSPNLTSFPFNAFSSPAVVSSPHFRSLPLPIRSKRLPSPIIIPHPAPFQLPGKDNHPRNTSGRRQMCVCHANSCYSSREVKNYCLAGRHTRDA